MAPATAGPRPPSTTCDPATTPWYDAPVIVGGSGGSGTRGVVLLLERLGVRMACIDHDNLGGNLTDANLCELPCNAASDCALISSFRAADAEVAWPRRTNFTALIDEDGGGGRPTAAALAPCDEPLRAGDVAGFERIASASPLAPARGCGANKAEALLRRLRDAIRAPHRVPLRWGLKNPHSTYYVNVLRAAFPCMVYVNTVRDVKEMARTAKHYTSRVHEAVRFGYLSAREGDALLVSGEAAGKGGTFLSGASAPTAREQTRQQHLAARTTFYARYVRDVNLGVAEWTARCMPGRAVHLPLQRMVALAPRAPACVRDAVAAPLARALRMDAARVLNVTRAFAAESLPLVLASIAEARRTAPRLALLAKGGDEAEARAVLRYHHAGASVGGAAADDGGGVRRPGLLLEPPECEGELVAKAAYARAS